MIHYRCIEELFQEQLSVLQSDKSMQTSLTKIHYINDKYYQ